MKSEIKVFSKFKYLALFVVLPLFASCISYKVPDLSLPSWYVSPKSNDMTNLYGVGEGYSSEEATKSALNNLSSKLMTTISSESTMLMEENNYGINEESRRRINENIAKTTFNNYRISNSAQKDGKIYAEVAVDRSEFTKNYNSKLGLLNKNMSSLFKSVQDKTILEKRNDLFRIKEMAKEAQTISLILSGLGFKDENFNLERNLKLYNSYDLAYEKTIGQIEFFISKDSNTKQRIVEIIRSNLNSKRIKISSSEDYNNNNLVLMSLKSYVSDYKIYGSFVTKLRVDLSLYSSRSKLIASNFVEVTGNSMIGKEESLNAAIAAFDEKINSEGILKITGIDNQLN